MRVLWLCNVVAPQFRTSLGLSAGVGGGWIEETLELLIEKGNCEIAYCAPLKGADEITRAEYRGVKFFGFSKQEWQPEKYDISVEKVFRRILDEFQPDIVHIFGTEFPHTLSMVKTFGKPEKTVIHLQGIMTYISQCYGEGIPFRTLHSYTFRDFVRHDNIFQKKIKFEKRAVYERQALMAVNHVMGRTEWDKACVKMINPDIKYHYCGENLRAVFAECHKWQLENCERNTIFMSQGDYPIKGLHIALEALTYIKRQIPDVKLYVAGENITNVQTFRQKLRMNNYQKYIMQLIDRWNLHNNIEFVGYLDARQMCDMYKRCHVFIMPSVIENSPNSLCEALQLGTPVVASFVGGIPEFVDHGENGFLYQHNAPYMLAHYVEKIFKDDYLAESLSVIAKNGNAKKEENNIQSLLEIYNGMTKDN